MADIRVKNIYHMLSYAFQSLRETGFESVAAEEFNHIHDLFAAILVKGIGAQVKRGLHRDYIPREEALPGVRGRICVAETIKGQMLTNGKLVCAYDEFSLDSAHNRVLKSTMLLLLRQGNVKPERKKALRKLLLYLGDVAEIEPQSIRWDALKYYRNNASYRMLIGICHMVAKGLLLGTESGDHKLVSWLQDEQMHRLFERFVLEYYRTHHRELKPAAPHVKWDLVEGSDLGDLPQMKTDITLYSGERQLIIDTKCYSATMRRNARFDSRTYISDHLYQIYAYVKNSDKHDTGNVAGVLLYAKTDETATPDKDYVIGGNRIGLKTLDLNRSWNGITDQLERLCEWLADDDCLC